MAKEKQLKDVDKLIEIGKLITRQETEFSKLKVSQVSAKAKATYNAAVSFIQQNEPEGMKDASNKQIHILGAIEELLVELRKSEMLDDMDAAIKKISKLASKAADAEGSQEAKKFIQSLSKNIISNAEMSKGQRIKSAIAGSLGAADLSIKSILDVKPLMDPSMWKPDSVIGILTTLLDTKKNKDKRKERRSIEDEIESKQKSLDPFHGKKTRKIKDAPRVEPKTTTSVEEPSQFEPKIGEQFQDFRGVKYEKWATGWRNVDTGKIEPKQNQALINQRYQERMKTFGGKSESQQKIVRTEEQQKSKQTFQFPDKISRLTIDRLVINKMVLPEKDPLEAPPSEQPSAELPDINIPRAPRAPKLGIGGLASFALGAAPMVALGGATLAADYAMENARELTQEGSSLDVIQQAVGGKGLKAESNMSKAEAMEKQTSTGWWEFGGKDKRIKKIQSDIDRGVTFDLDEAKIIKKNLGFDIPEENINKNITAAQSAVNVNAASISETTKRISQSEAKKQSAPIVINQPAVSTNAPEPPVVIPIKGSVRANESSFTRFQDRNFVR